MRRPSLPELRDLAFPASVLGAFSALTALGISGTSSTRLFTYLYGNRPDPHLLLGAPQGVRSDEWFVNTPLVLAQKVDGFPLVNHRLGTGMDMSLVFDVPYRDWSMLFRPQSWGFAFLPLDQAFAFKWWLPSVVLLLALYQFCLLVLPGRRLFAALLAGGVLAAPFAQWWFTSTTIGSLAWGFAAAAVFGSLLCATSRLQVILRSTALAYLCTCFALVLYPPFQVPCLLVVLAFCVGLLVMRLSEGPRRVVLKRSLAAVGAAVSAVLVSGLFALTRESAVRAVANTDYPGHRVSAAGGFTGVRLLYGALTPVLELRGDKAHVMAAALGGNPSEASAFLLIGLFLVGVQVWLIVRARAKGLPANGVLVALLVLLLVFLANLFLVSFNVPSKLLLLSLVPHNRLHIGLGMLSTALIVATVWELRRQDVRTPRWLVVSSGLATLGVTFEEAARVHQISPDATGGNLVVVAAGLLAAATVMLFASGRAELGAAGLLVFCLLAAGGVNPLYRGTFDTRDTPVGQAIRQVDAEAPGGWVSTAGLLGNALMIESGVHTYSGTFSYPGPGQWSYLDPTGAQHRVYNRYAQVVFRTHLSGPPLSNPQQDEIVVAFDPCGVFAQNRVQHLLTDRPLAGPCLRLDRQVTMPARTFYLYDVTAPA